MTDWRNKIIPGDARELAKSIPDGSIDCVFTDPPYPGEYVDLYEWLAIEAARILKPGGFCVAYAGSYHLDQVFSRMSGKGLNWYFMCTLESMGNATIIWPRRILARGKYLLMWTKDSGVIKVYTMNNIIRGGGSDKRFHRWGQDVGSAHYVLSYIFGDTTEENAGKIVFDPFVGGGTTAEAARLLGLDYLGFEIDDGMAQSATDRLDGVHPSNKDRQLRLLD